LYPQVFGKYVLERELSRGGMARVVLATLRGAGGFEKKLVVKQIRDELSFDQQFVRRFVEEAKTTVALSHPNIVPVYELGVEQGTYFLAMELVEGCSIAELVRERNADGTRRVLSPEEGAYVGMEVCRALDYAHRRMKVVHRDITPRNVMLDEEGQVKLIDFGIAAPALVAGHEILGSPGHMPPEQVDGKELGPPTDIFAVAVLLMEAWSGAPPFRRATPEECEAAMRGPHPRPSDFDPRLIPLDDVIVRAMRLDPKERQQEASELGRALRAFLQGTDVGDIARALGDRVRDLREAASEPAPMSREATMRAVAPSAGDLGTKTFAAREEAIRWSQPPPSEIVDLSDASEPPAASTRRLAESIPPPSEIEIPAPPRAPAAVARAKDPAMSIPTPLMMEPVGLVGDVVHRASRAASAHGSERPPPSSRRQRPDDRVDTIATRPLETPVHPRGGESRTASRKARGWTVGALAIGAAAVALVAWRARGGSSDDGRATIVAPPTASTSATTPTTTPTTPTPAVTPSSAAVEPSALPAPPHVPPTAPATGAHNGASTAATSAGDKTGGKALVTFLGDPGTRVSIDGVARGACPVRVSLDPGQHDARFSFDPTAESLSEGFRVKAGEKVTVRAEFTGARPTVRVHR